MWLDAGAAALVLVFGLWGFFRGLFSQAWGTASLAASLAGAAPALRWLQDRTGIGVTPTFFGEGAWRFFVGLALFLLLLLIGRAIEVFVVERWSLLLASNRLFGGVLGLLKGAFFTLVLFFFALHLAARPGAPRALSLAMEQSRLAPILRPWSPFNLLYVSRLQPYLPAEPGGPAAALPQELRHPLIEALTEDPAFLRAVAGRDLENILFNPTFVAAMKDEQVRARLEGRTS